MSANLKTCSKCKQQYNRSSDNFFRNKYKKDGYESWCKNCSRNYHMEFYRLKKYNISLIEFEKMLTSQNGKCQICGRLLKYGTTWFTNEAANIDHNHKTGKVRGILCRLCNQNIGQWNDNPLIFIKAAKYLHQNK